jgi:hypothetical protein
MAFDIGFLMISDGQLDSIAYASLSWRAIGFARLKLTETDQDDKVHAKQESRENVPDGAWESDVCLVKTKGRKVSRR